MRIAVVACKKWIWNLLMVVSLVGLWSAAPVQASHEDATEEEEGWKLVMERCLLCHYLDRPDFKFAPSLKDLYKRQSGRLMNGKPVNDDTVRAWINDGSPNMPAFKHTLGPRQVQLIVKFLKEGWAANVPMVRGSR